MRWARIFLVTRCSLALACAAGIASPDRASARALVEPGDLVVGFGAEVVSVRADGGGVAPITPRPGSGSNQIGTASGLAIDAASRRVLVGNPLGQLFVVDPDDGTQSPVTDALGAALTVGQEISSIAALASGEFLVASSAQLTPEPFVTYGSGLHLLGARSRPSPRPPHRHSPSSLRACSSPRRTDWRCTSRPAAASRSSSRRSRPSAASSAPWIR